MQQEMKLRKADIVLAVVFVMLAAAIFVWSATYFTSSGDTMSIKDSNGRTLGEYDISENAIIVIKGGEVVAALDGEEADLLGGISKDAAKKFAAETLGSAQYDGDVNVAVIENGKVYMALAGCDNQHCVKHAKINGGNEQIICLPNKIILQITDDGESEIDTVAE